jgi:hypothetical protein
MANQLSVKQCQLHHQKIQEAESTQVLYDVVQDPSDFLSRVRRFSPGVILAKNLSNNMYCTVQSLSFSCTVREVRERRANGIYRDSLMDKILEEQKAPGFDKSTALSGDKLAFLQ